MTRRGRLALVAVAAALVLLFGGRWFALRYTEHAWYADLGLGAHYWRLIARATLWRAGILIVATAWYAAHTLAVCRSIGSVHLPRRVGNLEIAEAVPRTWLRSFAVVIAVLLGLATAYSFSDIDHFAALYRHAVPLGENEPVLRKDAAFYLARLPLLELLQLAAFLSALLALLLAAGLYLLTGSLTIARRRMRITPHARTHLTIALAVFALALAWGFQLHAYQIVGGGGHHGGALTMVDRTIRLPASNALALVALAVAVGTAITIRAARAPVVLFLWATLLVAGLLGRLVVPALADAWGSGNVALRVDAQWVRDGFALGTVLQRNLALSATLPAESLPSVGDAFARVSPWSTEPGLLEIVLPPATGDTSFTTVWTAGVAAYQADDGRERLLALAVGQTDPLLATRANPRPRWTDLHRGALAWGGPLYAVDAAPRAGAPRFLPSVTSADTGSSVPRPVSRAAGRVRFLPRPAELAIVGPDEGSAAEPAPGVLLGGWPRRLLFAWALQSPPLLGSHTSEADRLLFWRDVPERLARLYPFASFDTPRAVLDSGRLLWLSDGSIASPRFPLAPHQRWRGEDVNYLAAPFVATVDAATGRTRLFVRPLATRFAISVAHAEDIDPLPSESLPAAVRAQLGFPGAIAAAQAGALGRILEDSAGALVNWSVAWNDSVLKGDLGLLRPAQALLDLGDGVRLWSLVPLQDQAGSHLSAIVASGADARGVTETRLLIVPRTMFAAPTAVQSRLSATAAAMSIATLAEREGRVQKGHVVPIPVAGTLAYGAALFATDSRASQPMQLRAFGVVAGDRVGVGVDAFDAARAAARGQSGSELVSDGALQAARSAFLTLDSAVRTADWAQVGRAYAQLKRALGLPEGQP